MDQVRLIGRIPESPHRGAMEEPLRRPVGTYEGLWARLIPQTPWYLIRNECSSDGFRSTQLRDPWEKPPELLATSSSEAKYASGQVPEDATAY